MISSGRTSGNMIKSSMHCLPSCCARQHRRLQLLTTQSEEEHINIYRVAGNNSLNNKLLWLDTNNSNQ